MIRRLIDLCISNQFIVFVFMLFLGLYGVYAIKNIRLNALPNIAPTEVIIKTNWSGEPPNLVNLRVSYPIESYLLSAPKVKEVRATSMYGSSFVTVVFDRGTKIAWARAQILTYMNQIKTLLPPGVTPVLGPYANALGWVYMYGLVDKNHNENLEQLRTLQQYYLRYGIESVPGVAQVATYGGFKKEYQVTLNPQALQYYNLKVQSIVDALKSSNKDIGARVIDSSSGVEHLVFVRGYLHTLKEIRNIVVGTTANHVPILVKNIGKVEKVPASSRSYSDLNGMGQIIGGVVIIQQGSNTLKVISAVKKKIKSLEYSLPKGVKIVTTYDESPLIHRSINTLSTTLLEIIAIVMLVCVLFLFHFRSSLVAIIMIPFAILGAFGAMYFLHISANIMSLSGIALAVGAMVDSSIVMIENAHTHIERYESTPEVCPEYLRNVKDKNKAKKLCIVESTKEMGKPLFFSLIIIAVGFLPVFYLTGSVGALFRPLAYTKTFSMLFAAFISVTLVPILMVYLIKGKIRPINKNPINRFLAYIYKPVLRFVMQYKYLFLVLTLILSVMTYFVYTKIGSEFMPPLNEGTLLYMPSALPGYSAADALKSIQIEDRIIKSFPEVKMVTAKAGRADTALDPAGLAMTETVIDLTRRANWPKGMTVTKLINNLNKALNVPGIVNVWTMPIKNRIEMTSAGLRTPIGIKVYGSNITKLQNISEKIASALYMVKGTQSAFANRINNRPYIEIKPNYINMGFYGITLKQIDTAVDASIGGKTVTTIYNGLARFPLSVRYPYAFRSSLSSINNVLVKTKDGAYIPLKEVAIAKYIIGPNYVSSQGGMLDDVIDITINTHNMVGWVKTAKKMVAKMIHIPSGYHIVFSGEYKSLKRANQRLLIIIPITILIIFLLIYLNFKSIPLSLIVTLSVPFSLIGAFFYLYLMHITLSIAVWIGIIALIGVSTEIGMVMITVLENTFANPPIKLDEQDAKKYVEDMAMNGAVKRLRPVVMTAFAIIFGLLPAMFAYGTGARTTKFIAAPMVGGMITATILNLLILPIVYSLWKRYEMKNK
jgi:Cu(I)/Ag(I) efflux system membrane protein CusA/SilA